MVKPHTVWAIPRLLDSSKGSNNLNPRFSVTFRVLKCRGTVPCPNQNSQDGAARHGTCRAVSVPRCRAMPCRGPFPTLVKACVAEEVCYDACYSDFLNLSRKCPCNAECERGCPCDSEYSCQPFIMALCQSSELPKIDFGYVVSAD